VGPFTPTAREGGQLSMVYVMLSFIPPWQVSLSIGLLILSIALGIYASIKILRIHMLMHGKPPGLKTLMRHFKDA
jgi:hypothetical protein